MRRVVVLASALAGAGVLAPSASAQIMLDDLQPYASYTLGGNFLQESDNAGAFTSDFVTGQGIAVPAGTVLPEGTDLGWTTQFDSGLFTAGAFGFEFAPFRVEAEVSYTQNDVDTHTGLTAGGNSLGAADAAVLITGSPPLGVTVEDLLADGQGDLTTLAYAVNGYVDYALPQMPFALYAGIGGGFAEVQVDFQPSGTTIIDDDSESAGFYQLMAGASVEYFPDITIFGGYRYRATEDVAVDSSLVPATLEVENTAHVVEIGLRYGF